MHSRAAKAVSCHWKLPAIVFVIANLLAQATRSAEPMSAPNASQRQELERRIADAEAELRTKEADVRAADARIASLKESLEKLPATVVTQKLPGPNAALDSMRQKLAQAEAEERELAKKLQDEHPRLLAARQRVRDLHQVLAEQPTEWVQTTEADNPARQAKLQELTEAQAAADALRSGGRELVALRDRLQGELQLLISQETKATPLPSNQAPVKPSPDVRQTPISVSPASRTSNATIPHRRYSLTVGLVAAVLIALGAARLAARRKRATISLSDLTKLLDLPLVGRLPRGTFHPATRA